MDLSRLPEPLRRAVEERLARPPMETASRFLGAHFNDAETLPEARAGLERLAQTNIRVHQEALRALEAVIADPPSEPNAVARLVAWDANWGLDDESDAGALAFLRTVAQMLREVIAQAPPSAQRWRWE
ncbi:hypothetical protein GCM10010172_62910 [Paractinoplanes ferrugineus]|uniref:Uncharacterized protein n=1 Tax=Paractinoplanes ferrugineus TaxID=113564 RepID=A0A919MH73_9ACTN|nr:hypothetical protein [Actinoplanes ferrugineus]GIE15528.1 hypothetical protein Afe05nite_73680 [Actinoplanes ferrugineus]